MLFIIPTPAIEQITPQHHERRYLILAATTNEQQTTPKVVKNKPSERPPEKAVEDKKAETNAPTVWRSLPLPDT